MTHKAHNTAQQSRQASLNLGPYKMSPQHLQSLEAAKFRQSPKTGFKVLKLFFKLFFKQALKPHTYFCEVGGNPWQNGRVS